MLRNTATDLHTLRLMIQLAWTSRNRTSSTFSYPIAIAGLAILHYTFFVVAGTFSNKLVNPSSNRLGDQSSAVLSRSPLCGVWNPDYYDVVAGGSIASLEDVDFYQRYLAKIDHNVQLSLEYAQECYRPNSTYYATSKCDSLPTRNLEFDRKKYNESCPFGPNICHDDRVIVLDTQVIDSHRHLGINAPKGDRLTYRRRTTCAVLNDTGHVIESNQSTSEAMAQAFYGSSISQGTEYTYSFSNYSSLYTEFTPQSTIPYQVNTQMAYGASSLTEDMNLFAPLPELQQKSADLMLFFLSFNGRYFEPIDDPWFSAHQLHQVDTPAPIARKQYARDRLISTLGCKEEHQFCDPNNRCTPFLGWGQVQAVDSFNNGLRPKQNVTFDRMLRAVYTSSIAQVVASLAKTKTPLLAIDAAALGTHVISLKLPDNQWELELLNWHSIALAQLQRTIVQWSTGQIAPDPATQLVPPETKSDSFFCHNLRVPSTVYQSFCILYLILILAIGMLVIIISWNVENVVGWMRLHSSKGANSRKVWDDHNMLGFTKSMTRQSWRPMPPPKDYAPPAQEAWPLKSIPLATLRPVHSAHRITESENRRSHFPRFLAPVDAAAFGNDQEKLLPRPSTPRMWSQLPPEPSRDSWVETNLDGQNAASAEALSYVFENGRGKSSEVSERSRTGRALELADLRAHALARIRGP